MEAALAALSGGNASRRRKLQAAVDYSTMTEAELKALLTGANAAADAAKAEADAAAAEAKAKADKVKAAEAKITEAYTTKPVIEGAVSLED